MNKQIKKKIKKHLKIHCKHCNQVCGTEELLACIVDEYREEL